MIPVLLLTVMGATVVLAQTTNGRIVGTVSDSSGAVVSGAKVTARNLGTNITDSALANHSGNYVFPNLLIGAYEVSAEAKGFKRYSRRPVELQVDQTVRVDIQLQLGDVSERITVQGGAPVIQTDQSSIGQVVSNETVVQLPQTAETSSGWAV
jgi:hypothetical protein